MAIAVILELEIKPAFVTSFEDGMRDAFVDTRAFPGCISINACKHDSRPNTYVFLEHWREHADYQNYIKWRSESKFMEQLVPMLVAQPVPRILPIVI
jgi:quinol monooxygenase YgiN